MIRLIDREFVVHVDLQHAWNHLANVESWPTWATHIKRIVMEPAGTLTQHSRGTIQIRNGIKSRFEMTEYVEHEHWKWSGPFLWLTVHYDHQFIRETETRTRLRWNVEAEGWAESVLGRLFARIYNGNLNRAIPNLINEMDSTPKTDS